MIENALDNKKVKLVLVGKRKVVRMGKDRYMIYLPTSLNKLWSNLNARKQKVLVYVELSAE